MPNGKHETAERTQGQIRETVLAIPTQSAATNPSGAVEEAERLDSRPDSLLV